MSGHAAGPNVAMSSAQSTVQKMYKSVIDEVMSGVKESFFDDGMDDSVLQELKALWESKLAASKAMENGNPMPNHHGNPVSSSNHQFLPHGSSHGGTRYAQPQQGGVVNRQLMPQSSVIRIPQGHQVLQQAQYVIQQQPGMGMMSFAQPSGNHVIVKNANQQLSTTTTITLDQLRAGFVPVDKGSQPSVILVKQPAPGQSSSSNLPQLDGSAEFPDPNSTSPSCSGSSKDLEIVIVIKGRRSGGKKIPQLDGPAVLSDDESDDEFVDDDPAPIADVLDDEEEEDLALEDPETHEEAPPLGPEDDISDEEDPDEMFEAENVVVCQYEKINRTKNKWKLVLKDGIMSLNGKDYVFQKATGEAEW